jgi:DNA anti-recombination protein RmuC
MKRFAWLIPIIMVAFVAACAPQTDHSGLTGKAVVEQAKSALSTLETYLQQQNDVHRKSAEAKMDRLSRRIGILQARANKMGDEAKASLEKQLTAYKAKEESLKQKLEKMKEATGDTWESMVADIGRGVNDLENEFDKLLGKI